MRKFVFISLALYIVLLAAVAVLFSCKSHKVLHGTEVRETATSAANYHEILKNDSVVVLGDVCSSSLHNETTAISYDYDTTGRLIKKTTISNRKTTTRQRQGNTTTKNGRETANIRSNSHETTQTGNYQPQTKTTQQTKNKQYSFIIGFIIFIVIVIFVIIALVKLRLK